MVKLHNCYRCGIEYFMQDYIALFKVQKLSEELTNG